MSERVEAIYENGLLRPLRPLTGVQEHHRVVVYVEDEEGNENPLAECVGILPDADAEEMSRIVEEEFEKVDLSEWR